MGLGNLFKKKPKKSTTLDFEDINIDEPQEKPEKPAKSAKPQKPAGKPKKKGGLFKILILLIVCGMLGGGGWFGWNWYQNKKAAEMEAARQAAIVRAEQQKIASVVKLYTKDNPTQAERITRGSYTYIGQKLGGAAIYPVLFLKKGDAEEILGKVLALPGMGEISLNTMGKGISWLQKQVSSKGEEFVVLNLVQVWKNEGKSKKDISAEIAALPDTLLNAANRKKATALLNKCWK